MNILLDYMAANPFSACFMACLLACLLAEIARMIFKILNRMLRSLNILFRGWPPEHLDADGDFNTYEDEEPVVSQ